MYCSLQVSKLNIEVLLIMTKQVWLIHLNIHQAKVTSLEYFIFIWLMYLLFNGNLPRSYRLRLDIVGIWRAATSIILQRFKHYT